MAMASAKSWTEACTVCGKPFTTFTDVICPPCKAARAAEFWRTFNEERKQA